MDRGQRRGRSRALNKASNIFMDLGDIIREHALRYLPAKSLLRCRAVCRNWKLHVSSPFFAHSQSYFFSSPSGLFGETVDGTLSFFSFDSSAYGVPDPELKFLPEPVELLASSNGLLCFRGRNTEHYYVSNPVSKQWKKIPKPDANHGSHPAPVLIFEPSQLNFVAEFKIVCPFPSADIDGAHEFEIYSSVDDSWKISPEICFGEQAMTFQHGGVCVNGVVYWIVGNSSIIGFDLKKNRSTMIKSPYHFIIDNVTLCAIDGKLCVSSRNGTNLMVCKLSNAYANTMQMSSDNRQWVTQNQSLNQPGLNFGSNERGRSVLAAIDDLIVFKDGSKIYSYNRTTKEIKTLSTGSHISCTLYVPYVNSLVCL